MMDEETVKAYTEADPVNKTEAMTERIDLNEPLTNKAGAVASSISPVTSIINRDPTGAEPIVMNEETLRIAVEAQALEDRVTSVTKKEGIEFNQVLKLRIEYKDILMIDHLSDFTSLTKLDLNNNLIERIEGLDYLTNLTWLNLSFNRIGRIQGLESLEKLEVLNLANNRICVIENMDKLERLTHFIIANNLIRQLDNVLYLRRFKNLFTLTISGNPFSTEDDYKLFIAAYFPNLTCIDYRKITEQAKNEASVKYKYVLEELRSKELDEQQAANAEQSRKAELQLHKDAFVEFLNGSHLFKNMLKDDPEAETLHSMPEVAQQLQTFESQMVELCMQLFETGLAEHKQRETEVNSLLSVRDRTVTNYQQKASHVLANFEQQHKARIINLQQLSEPEKINECNQCDDELDQLSKSLMSLEFQLVSQVEDTIKMLDENLSNMVGNFTETVQGIFAQCRDLEDNYFQNVRRIATATLEKVARDKLEEDASGDVKMLFTDRDTVMDALATAHDNHLLKINDRETVLLTRLNAWKAALIKRIEDEELKKNRMRMSDIYRYVTHVKDQLTELL
ncbi:dynein regulatory complex subunit 3 [Betta splendens]|uniref:Dynein regulatory complex subunit 3 n=1 Tax=Betta splendens TaxID=158456 RepID=A0A9W2XZJ6_BETSP|nr:dynein regulatory complex subunit 3 [Betta splendens]